MKDWDPQLYRKFETERTRPAKELLAQITTTDALHVTDLGCGPGNSTELLVAAWPQAQVTGIDTSEAMLTQARERLPKCDFLYADIQSWHPDTPQNVIYANASLQWLNEHDTLLPHLINQLTAGGTLAIQMPDNLNEPSHRLMREVAAQASWNALIGAQALDRKKLLTAERYYDLLTETGCEVNIWRTTYYHVMPDISAVISWLKATGLRPFLAPLDDAQQNAFLEAYHEQLSMAYSSRADGQILLSFPRLFIVAMKKHT
ncbi:MAG: trans-aconitate 2-methyltransferase [Enterobacterales bacterium endosymbiont of Blomia tropicalis]|uniref:trans-aconitate 2-methyltransferase n=1 Tax=Mixta mediterraneensis TaxID=2758443 RepID=UPI0025A717CF|nr:trans-aconitate 2-methyltransferase [Mixta mediterraneensis]MDL4915841.1 trans-aconitate 2-methyltransferase [Mixta mediterraneensis]